jgi:antitoxin component HigA of HigAB toxin-antitoxin module
MKIHPVKTERDYRKALELFLGSRSRVSEVLNRKRSLSMS